MLHIDAHFSPGRGHAVCQDYALATAGGAVICDGCSSAPHSDVGARLLAHAAAATPTEALLDRAWLREPQIAARRLGLPEGCLDATCIVARAAPEGIDVCMFGDGVVAARRRADDQLVIIEVTFPQSAPPYPSYALCTQRHAVYEQAGLGVPRLVASAGAPSPRTEHDALQWCFPRSQWSSVMIGSDGLCAFQAPDGSRVAPDHVVSRLFRFPSPHGAFVTRRLKRYVAKEAPACGLQPYDDVAVAALCWGAP